MVKVSNIIERLEGLASPLTPAHTTADFANRIALTKDFADFLQLDARETGTLWLYLVQPGRFRILFEDQVNADSQLESIRALLVQGRAFDAKEASEAESLARAAMVVKLLPASISPPPPRWRISFPKGFDPFVPKECDPKAFSILLSPEGYVEVWYTDVLRKAVFSTEVGRVEA
jgi:hypothetical protein